MKSFLVIHLLAASLASGSLLSRTRAIACCVQRAFLRTPYGILDNSESASPIMDAVP